MLSRRARVVLDTLIPSGAHPDLPQGIQDVEFERFHAHFERTAHWRLRLGWRVGLVLAIWAAPLLILKLPPITLHDRATREAALTALFTTRWHAIRNLVLVLKVVAAFAYGADPAVRRAVGFPAQPDDPTGGVTP